MLSSKVKTNLSIYILSFIVAIGLWYNVSVYDVIVAQVDVRIDYKGRNDNLIILDGLVNSLKVRMRGPKTLIRAMTAGDLAYTIDLSNIKKGKIVIPFNINAIDDKMRSIDVIEIYPQQLDLVVDAMANRVVKLVPKFKYNYKNTIKKPEIIKVTPKSVILHGPQSLIDKQQTLPLEIPIDLKSPSGVYTKDISVFFAHSNLITARPHEIKVEYRIISERKKITVSRNIRLGAGMSKNIKIEPDSFTLDIEVPEELAHNASYLNKIYLSTVIGAIETNKTIEIPLKYVLPEGAVLLSPLLKKVKVTKTK